MPTTRSANVVSERHPLSLYHDGEQAGLRLMASTPESAAPQELAWQVEDFWGEVRLSGTWLPGRGRQVKRISGAGLGRGWYRASVAWSDGHARAESTFAILPPPERTGEIADSPFGAHFAVDPSGLAVARAVGVRWLRLHPPNHTKWRVVEPSPGEWRWRDDAIQIALDAGLSLIGSLDRCPTWASSAPEGIPDRGFYTGTGAWLPRDWAEWEAYVARTVRRYKDVIRIWEIWNEGNLGSWLKGSGGANGGWGPMKETNPKNGRSSPLWICSTARSAAQRSTVTSAGKGLICGM